MTIEHGVPLGAEFDHHSPEFRDCPHGAFQEMRATCPVSRSDRHGGFWSLVDYQSVFDAARDDALFSSLPAVGIPASGSPFPILPIESDPPLTHKLRQVTLRLFSPGSAERLRPRARQMATEMVNSFIGRGECDISAELTTPLPAKLTLHMLGFDESKYLQWVSWVHTFVHTRAHDETAGTAAMESILGEIHKHMTERRASGELGDDLFGAILNGHVDGAPLDDMQIITYTMMTVLGGMDTTSGLTSNTLLQMVEHPELRQALIDRPELLKPATEELLRHSTPALGLARTVSRDTEFHGQQLKEGDPAILMWAAANRDPAVFEDPDTIDFARPNAHRHMAFGVGAHRCIGSHLARVMFQEMILEILERIPDFELNGTPIRFEDAGEVYALRRLPIRFTAGAVKNSSAVGAP